jgi:hypothetical protein
MSNQTPRHPVEVAKQLVTIIPETLNKRIRVISEIPIDPYAAPEVYNYLWDELEKEINRICDVPKPLTKEWQVEIVAIFTTMSPEQVREKFFEIN